MVILLDGAGWCGGIMMVVAYVLVSTRRGSVEARSFQLLNIAGGILLTGTTRTEYPTQLAALGGTYEAETRVEKLVTV